jgi:hypothetical protein
MEVGGERVCDVETGTSERGVAGWGIKIKMKKK